MKDHRDDRNESFESLDQANQKAILKSKVSRRGFLSSVGVGAISAAIGGGADAQGSWSHEADIVVVGTGAAGSSAALNSHRLGNSVLMLEKAETIYGGTTAHSGGGYWTPNNSQMRALGIQDSREDALRYMLRVAYPQFYDPKDPHLGVGPDEYELYAAFYDNAAPAVEALESMTTLKSKTIFDPDSKPGLDYRSDLPEDKGIRGRGLGPGLGTSTGGGAYLIRVFKQAVDQKGIPVLFSHRASRLLLNGKGEVAGLEAKTLNGQTATIRARKAVIFGTGGFAHNLDLRHNFLRGPIFGSCSVATNEGDFVYIATAAGASLANMGNAWWSEVVVEMSLDPSSTPLDLGGLAGDSMIAVNRYGQRIVSETINSNDRGQVHFVWNPERNEYPNLLTFMIYDQRTAERYAGRFPIAPSVVHPPYIISGQTIEELVHAIEARLDTLAGHTANFRLDPGFGKQLEQTIARFNEFAKRGVDEDFHRGESPYELARLAGKLFPISAKGPYFTVILGGGCSDTHGGPKINARAQIVDGSGKPIPGLYGAGNCIAFAGQAYFGLGGTIGPALTFGYIAALEASKESTKEV